MTYERQKVRRQEGERGRKMELPHDARLPCNSFRPPTLTVDVIETLQPLWSYKQLQTTPSFLPPLYRSHRSSYCCTKATAALATAFSHESIRRKRREETEERESQERSTIRSVAASRTRGHGRQLFRRRRRRSGGRSPTKISPTRQVRH